MRLLIRLKVLKDFAYDLSYYHKLQGFAYGLIRGGEYGKLHDLKGNKFFCFSNIFPLTGLRFQGGQEKLFIISSPDKGFIKHLETEITKMREEKKPLNIGEMSFGIEGLGAFEVRLGRSFKLISATPIIIRIPEKKYDACSVEEKKKRYVYWRPEIAFYEGFVEQLTKNIFRKYNEFYHKKVEGFPLFSQFIFKKTVVSHVIINGIEQRLIGSVWEFVYNNINKEQRKVLEFAIDSGFGERNPLGFGFMNVIKEKRIV